ncbi:MAG: hypothetical protein R3E45_07665 [Rhodocyclaceae bacterium]
MIDFSDAYAPSSMACSAPAMPRLVKAADLSGKVLGVTRGSVEDLELTKIAPADLTIKRFEDNNATISALPHRPRCSSSRPAMWWPLQSASMTKLRRLDAKFLIKNSPCYVGMAKGEDALAARSGLRRHHRQGQERRPPRNDLAEVAAAAAAQGSLKPVPTARRIPAPDPNRERSMAYQFVFNGVRTRTCCSRAPASRWR